MTTNSVLIPSFARVRKLQSCLRSLAVQSPPPSEVVVVWQGDDTQTRVAAEALRPAMPGNVVIVHSPQVGIVPAENVALGASSGEIVLLIDDDALAPPGWITRHISYYEDPAVGAVGGPVDNFYPDGSRFPKRTAEPVGKLAFYGRSMGNMYDHVPAWRGRAAREVDLLAGANMSLRRRSFYRFEAGLKPYWQMFETEVCLQVREHGYRILFDFANHVSHFPTNTVYAPSREGDLTIRVYNAAYNRAFVLAKHSVCYLRPVRLLYLLLIGSTSAPGILGTLRASVRFGVPAREVKILAHAWMNTLQGWRDGTTARRSFRVAQGSSLPSCFRT